MQRGKIVDCVWFETLTSSLRGWSGAGVWPRTGVRFAAIGSGSSSSSVSYSVQSLSLLLSLSVSYSLWSLSQPSNCKMSLKFLGSSLKLSGGRATPFSSFPEGDQTYSEPGHYICSSVCSCGQPEDTFYGIHLLLMAVEFD